ncbi:PspA-associated protein PspAB [Streptomyces laurentii]|jgi:hypothetical protein|uniref:PspA-associated protein PspAB n=1 Tax=Streptomyces laurentii TaxID=39478 RepID=UPI003685CEC5
MGLLDTIFGRSKPVRPDLDRLFALPAAALTLEAGTGYIPTGAGSVCFAGVEGGAFTRLKEDVRELLDVDERLGAAPVAFSQDAYGYTWLAARRPADDLITLVNDLHGVNSLLEEAGFGPQLLCSLTVFRAEGTEGGSAPRGHDLALVYLYKRGTFYPFAPRSDGTESRDNTLELQVRGLLAGDLAMEPDLERWFPVWGAPGLGEADRY